MGSSDSRSPDYEAARDEVHAKSLLLAELDRQRSEVMGERDRALVAWKAEGATWVEMQKVAGLTPHGVRLALNRAKEEEGKKQD